MLVKVTDALWLESRNVKLVRIAERTRGQGLYYIVWSDMQDLGEFQTKAEAQEFAQSIVDKLNETPSKFLEDLSERVMKELIAEAKVKAEATA